MVDISLLEDHEGLHQDVCCYAIAHGDANDQWLLDPNLVAPTASTEKVLNTLHDIAFSADTFSVPSGIYRPEVMETIEQEIDRLSPQLRELSLKIHAHPELRFREQFAHDTLSDFMAYQDFEVTKQYKSHVPSKETPRYMTTAWRAAFTHTSEQAVAHSSHSARTLGINSEMDALPIPKGSASHACGHNLIAIAGVAVALGVKKALEVHDVAGSVVLLGTPAEEGGHGKARLVEAGAYKEMDTCIMCHPGSGPKHMVTLASSLAIQAINVNFKGKPYAALQPWDGINAQDAVVHAFNSVSMLRQQLRPELRVHGVVHFDKSPLPVNVIPSDMSMVWNIRAPTKQDLGDLRERVLKCFQGAATATGCSLNFVCKQPLLNLQQNSVLAREFARTAANRCGMTAAKVEDSGAFSTDFGNVTYELPGLHPAYTIPTAHNGANHTAEFAAAAAAREAHDETIKVAKALALTGFRIIDDEAFFREVRGIYIYILDPECR
ncbi:uncharacterized protein PHACADRAFT_135410 [Phanerochaete carnosa HHB-10118-sp]|uniref:Peptidase M20 dimerisation domain-containing protein n=1 Tax=Phanerochaete carnosa (strain HHB-10118-sp) TaxID=650164 RepID=K5XEV5_PHACS|nr:uncharacterized protein PHACADRAFT_135410 [Phanerochaete carnosa HHB-10118-sp]EKM61617.1 hypothetical protein PHACADRAFT_135410 [Phanerochaete carnosa HHB-10118-sp]